MITRESSLPDVAFAVCTALHAQGVEAVLTGGSAATVYAPHACQSRDIDFVIVLLSAASHAGEVIASLGYRRVSDHYEHAENPLILEFPKGPLAVGRKLIRAWNTLQDGDRVLHVINPTDSCRDRLAGFMFWNDRSSLEQAVAVARARRDDIDMEAIRDWCRSEGKEDAYLEFERALEAA